jgi:hypothetical protein
MSMLAGQVLISHLSIRLTHEKQNSLEGPVTLNEVQQAIRASPRRKAPDPDGLPNEFYTTFTEEVASFPVALFRECDEEDVLPPSFG